MSILLDNYFEVHNNLGSIYYELGQRDQAINSYKQALSINPDSADALNNMNCDFFGLDETRTVQREFQIPGYFCIFSGCDNGNHGVELWVKTDSTIRVYDSLSDVRENVDISPSEIYCHTYRTPCPLSHN